MSLLSGASVWTNTNSNAKPTIKRQATIGRTAKPKEPDPPSDDEPEPDDISPSARVNSLLEAMTQNDGSGLADFEPIKHPEINILKNNETQPSSQFAANDVHLAKHTNYAQTYSAPRIYQGRPQPQLESDKFMEKINYMIHLLEEQQHEKTANISEEFVLYTLLGVFVIFTVDSFTRAGRYVR
jgi:hypothetical protein